jgi:hypothetical protein
MQPWEVDGQHELIWRHAWEPNLTFGRHAERASTAQVSLQKLLYTDLIDCLSSLGPQGTYCPVIIPANVFTQSIHKIAKCFSLLYVPGHRQVHDGQGF